MHTRVALRGSALQVYYHTHPTACACPHPLVLFIVPKRHLKKAVDRNRVRRLLREAYRLNQHLVPADLPYQLWIAFAYKLRVRTTYKEISEELKSLLIQLTHQLPKPNNECK